MTVQVKVLTSNTQELEKKVRDWIKKQKDLSVVSTAQSQNNDSITLSIFYHT